MKKTLLYEITKYLSGISLLVLFIEVLSFNTVLPNWSETLRGFTRLYDDGSLMHNIQVSSARWIIGWGMGSIIGILLGIATGRLLYFRLVFEGLLIIFRAIPFICLVPISMLLFGLDESGKFFLVAWASGSIAWIIVHDASGNINPRYKYRAISLGATKVKWFFKVLLRLCSEGIFSALRASLSIGLIVVAVAEMSGVYESSSGYWWSEGLGYQMFRSLDEARSDLMMAAILTFAMLGIIGDIVLCLMWKYLSYFRTWYRQKEILFTIKNIKLNDSFSYEWEKGACLSVEHLTSGYGTKKVINNLSFNVPAGSTMCIVGPSGCGKSTLIKTIAHFIDDYFKVSGSINIGDISISSAGSSIGIVMQDALLFEHLSVWDNVLFGDRISGSENAQVIALSLLREFEMDAYAHELAKNLSGGQRQRVALASAIANKPKLLLLDEPFAALDAITRSQLQQFYMKNIHNHITSVFVTHDVNEALLVGDYLKIGVDKDKKIIHINKENLPIYEWERQDTFYQYKKSIMDILETT